MAKGGGTDQEIADALAITIEDLKARHGPQLTQWRAIRRVKLRIRQTALAQNGNATILNQLGKYELGQHDKNLEDDDGYPEPWLEPKMG